MGGRNEAGAALASATLLHSVHTFLGGEALVPAHGGPAAVRRASRKALPEPGSVAWAPDAVGVPGQCTRWPAQLAGGKHLSKGLSGC